MSIFQTNAYKSYKKLCMCINQLKTFSQIVHLNGINHSNVMLNLKKSGSLVCFVFSSVFFVKGLFQIQIMKNVHFRTLLSIGAMFINQHSTQN